jgi:glycosyltransferase involved in cell wall biosynthesis
VDDLKPIRVVWVGGEPTPYREPHLAAVAAHRRIDLHVVYPARTIQRRTWTVPEARARTTYLRGPALPLSRLLHHDYPLTPGVVRLLERERPDCVIVSGWALLATQLAIVWCRLRGTPYLLASDSHGAELRATWRASLKRRVLPPVVRGAAGWLAAGTLAAEDLARYGADPERTIVFPLTVDVEALAERAASLRPRRETLRAGLGAGPSDVVVLHVGRLIAFKRIDRLVEAVARAAQAATAPVRLVLVGDGPEEGALRRLARTRGVEVIFAGFREGDALVAAYVAADVLALVSERETWGVVVNEAMACGLPLVLSDRVGAAADLLVPGENGERVRSGDVEGLAQALAALADDPQRRARYGRRSRELVGSWTYDAGVEPLAELLARVAGSAGGSRPAGR